MKHIEKTVFISYRRRTDAPWAWTIFYDLTHHGYDVFLDFNGIASGDFERVILENIGARAHFLVVLTPSALERCDEPADWLRREIETALDTQRNIVPLTLDGFDFDAPTIAGQLTGKLTALKRYNALPVPMVYFEAAMVRLREKHLSVPLDTVLHPASPSAGRAAKDEQAAARSTPAIKEEELTSQEWSDRGFYALDLDEKLGFYSQAIRLQPDFAEAFYNRGVLRHTKGDLEGALQDYTEAIRLNLNLPELAEAFYNRGNARYTKGDLGGALQDYHEAIRLKPDHAPAVMNRGNIRKDRGDLEGALLDYNEAIRIKPDFAEAIMNRGTIRRDKGDLEGALQDYNKAILLKPDVAEAFYNRGVSRHTEGDLEGALQDYTEAIRLKPDFKDAFNNRAIARHDKGDLEGAQQDHNEVIRLTHRP